MTVTAYVPAAEPVHKSVDVWLEPSAMLVGFNVQARPTGELDVRVTVPVKPFTEDTVMMEDPTVPTVVVMATGLAAMEKSGAAKLLPNMAD